MYLPCLALILAVLYSVARLMFIPCLPHKSISSTTILIHNDATRVRHFPSRTVLKTLRYPKITLQRIGKKDGYTGTGAGTGIGAGTVQVTASDVRRHPPVLNETLTIVQPTVRHPRTDKGDDRSHRVALDLTICVVRCTSEFAEAGA